MTIEEAVAELKNVSDLLPLEDGEVIAVVLAALDEQTKRATRLEAVVEAARPLAFFASLPDGWGIVEGSDASTITVHGLLRPFHETTPKLPTPGECRKLAAALARLDGAEGGAT